MFIYLRCTVGSFCGPHTSEAPLEIKLQHDLYQPLAQLRRCLRGIVEQSHRITDHTVIGYRAVCLQPPSLLLTHLLKRRSFTSNPHVFTIVARIYVPS